MESITQATVSNAEPPIVSISPTASDQAMRIPAPPASVGLAPCSLDLVRHRDMLDVVMVAVQLLIKTLFYTLRICLSWTVGTAIP
jgi:hypothetical protein